MGIPSTDVVKWSEVYATDSNVLSSSKVALGSASASKVRIVMHEVRHTLARCRSVDIMHLLIHGPPKKLLFILMPAGTFSCLDIVFIISAWPFCWIFEFRCSPYLILCLCLAGGGNLPGSQCLRDQGIGSASIPFAKHC